LNIARFCAEASVSQNAFYVWKKRLLATAQQDRVAMPVSSSDRRSWCDDSNELPITGATLLCRILAV